jgi:Tfp pilus assembly protein PilV
MPRTMAAMRDERGFSLVEVMAAFLVLTVVITVSMAAFLERNKRLQQATELVLAYQALANEAEYWRRVRYDWLESQAQSHPTSFQSIKPGKDVLAPLEPYETNVAVTVVKPGVSSVTMTVFWRTRERSAQLTIMRARTGVGGTLW